MRAIQSKASIFFEPLLVADVGSLRFFRLAGNYHGMAGGAGQGWPDYVRSETGTPRASARVRERATGALPPHPAACRRQIEPLTPAGRRRDAGTRRPAW